MELATLPGHRGKDRGAGGAQAGVIIADDKFHAAQAASLKALQEASPMNLRFAERGRDPQDLPFAIRADAHGDEHGAVQQLAAVADFFITGIQNQIRKNAQGALAPVF
jgi:hypothetical protein